MLARAPFGQGYQCLGDGGVGFGDESEGSAMVSRRSGVWTVLRSDEEASATVTGRSSFDVGFWRWKFIVWRCVWEKRFLVAVPSSTVRPSTKRYKCSFSGVFPRYELNTP